jgi:hypothetical protein
MVGAIYVGLMGWIMLGKDFDGDRIIPHLGWRAFAIVSAVPVIVAFVLATYVVPESPRYLVGKHKYSEAVSSFSSSLDPPLGGHLV